jgi:O-antigen/teichoic acid export membrane protein
MVILYISAGYTIEMATGINQVIIGNSKFYRYDALFVLAMVVVIIISNYILIPIYGITGSAIATAITGAVGNLLRYLLLYKKYNMQPYTINSVKLIFIGVVSFLSGYLIPYLNNLYLDIFVRSSITSLIFLLLLLKMEAAPELNQKIRKNLLHLQKK